MSGQHCENYDVRRSFGVIRVRISDSKSVWIMVQQRNRRVRSFGVIRVRISDPRSVWIMVHQRNRRIHDPNSDHPKGTHSPVPLMHHDPERSWITDPNSDHPKGTHPKCGQLIFYCENERLITNSMGIQSLLMKYNRLTVFSPLPLFTNFSSLRPRSRYEKNHRDQGRPHRGQKSEHARKITRGSHHSIRKNLHVAVTTAASSCELEAKYSFFLNEVHRRW